MNHSLIKAKFEFKTRCMALIRPFFEIGYKIIKRKQRKLIKNKKIAIYTAVFGGYDKLAPIMKQSINIDWICFTDKINDAEGWTCIVKQAISEDNRMAAKWFKINASLVDELSEYDHVIYIDASAKILSSYFAEIFLSMTEDIGFFPHPSRTSILKEAEVSSKMAKYKDLDLVKQASNYIDEMKCDTKLWAGGVIVRKHKIPDFDSAWWSEMSKSLQDQISLPFAAFKTNIKISPLPTSLYSHIFIRFDVLHRINEYKLI